jgi:predicted DNA-binding transcriptional regulator AlpA
MTQIFNPEDRLLCLGEVQRILPLSKSRIYYLISIGEFIPPIKIGQSKSYWLSSEIHEYVQSRLDERNSKQLQNNGGAT